MEGTLGWGRLDANDDGSISAAGTSFALVDGVWRLQIIANQEFGGFYTNSSGATTPVQRALTIIHELGHAYYNVYGGGSTIIRPDRNDPEQSERNRLNVDGACRP
jgi:hypothetical protein